MKLPTIPIKKLEQFSEPINVDLLLTEEEKKRLIGVYDVTNISCSYKLTGNGQFYSIEIFAEADFTVLDNHTFQKVIVHVADDADLSLDTDNPENSDIAKGYDGYYDLRPAFLALIFSMAPLDYSSQPLNKIENSDFTFMSEDEYQDEKAKQNNPFSKLN